MQSTALPQDKGQSTASDEQKLDTSKHDLANEEKQGGMSRRLSQITDEYIEQGGGNSKKAFEEGGFSDELKRRLEARIQDSTFKNDNSTAFAQVNLRVSLRLPSKDAAKNSLFHSLAQAKELEMLPPRNHGLAQKKSKTRL